eukprot:CCRYP_018225-RA/>CCRYP_018225-RA protein AED:0.40 eAED:0.50 QI:1076/0/0.5/1/0/0/2/0/79
MKNRVSFSDNFINNAIECIAGATQGKNCKNIFGNKPFIVFCLNSITSARPETFSASFSTFATTSSVNAETRSRALSGNI